MAEPFSNLEPARDPMAARSLSNGRFLAPHHAELIKASAISDAVRDARGYYTATKRRELRDLGFSDRQQQVVREAARSPNPTTALVLPVHSVAGEVPLHLIRPDEPVRGGDGRAIKYMQPSGSRLVLDVPPPVRHLLRDPVVPLWITEGLRKADAAASIGLCCIGLFGVWAWKNGAVLPDFEYITLKDRTVNIAFDSDFMTKPDVHSAARRLKAVLEGRGAVVRVVYLSAGEHGDKVGLDDYLAAGHGVADLLALASDQLRELADHQRPGEALWKADQYTMTLNGTWIAKHDRQGVPYLDRLANFAARIARNVIEDDGSGETHMRFECEIQKGQLIVRATVAAERFPAMNWPLEALGADAVVSAGFGNRDQMRAAVQLVSQGAPMTRVFTHTGWRKVNEEWIYLHASGAIGAQGTVEGVEVALPVKLSRYELPTGSSPELVRQCVRASLGIANPTFAPDRITVPLLGAVYRAVLGPVNLSMSLVGRTGLGKTQMAALCTQHFGPGMDSENLPANWSSTPNQLEGLAFLAKDTVLVMDNLAPATVGRFEKEKQMSAAARLLHAAGNRQGRGRATTSGEPRADRPPRGLVLVTAEEMPDVLSGLARTVLVEFQPGDIDGLTGRDQDGGEPKRGLRPLLFQRQEEARKGRYAAAMAGYIQWLAPQMEGIAERVKARVAELLKEFRGDHARTAPNMAELYVGWEIFTEFAVDIGAISQAEREGYLQRVKAALDELAVIQDRSQSRVEPTTRYFELLSGALTSGRAHVAGRDGRAPVNPAAWGWRERDTSYVREWTPQGERVGWVEGNDLYLDPTAAYKAAEGMGVSGARTGVGPNTLSTQFKEKGLLVSSSKERPAVKLRMDGAPKWVLHLRANVLQTFLPVESGTSGTEAREAPSNTDREYREQPASEDGHEQSGVLSPLKPARQIQPPAPTDIAADEEASQDDEEDGWEPLQ